MAQETEAKFLLLHPADLKERVEALGAELVQPRAYERNLRFDTPNGDLRRAGRVLRLRQDERTRVTYKDSGSFEAGVVSRRELEFIVSDFEAAREFLEALGYEVSLIYEKYRTIFKLGGVEIMLDEMPYGHFVEIEGEVAALRQTAERLNLHWEYSIPVSYSALFERLLEGLRLQFRDLTFENFKDIQVSPEHLGVVAADS